MNRISITALLCIAYFSLTGQVNENLIFGCKYSYLPKLIGYTITFKYSRYDMSPDPSDYRYNVNSGCFGKIIKIETTKEDLIQITLDTIKLQPGNNVLKVIFKRSFQDYQATFDIIFVNPYLKNINVTQKKQVTQKYEPLNKLKDHYLVYSRDTIQVNYEADFEIFSPSCDIQGSKTLTGISYKFGDDDWKQGLIKGSLYLTRIKPGINLLLITYKTAVFPEISYKTDTLKFFYIDFKYPVNSTGSFCNVDKDFIFVGIPEGGYFVGDGIVGKSTIFNPHKAGSGTHTLYYQYKFKGIELQSNPIEVTVEPDVIFEIEGPKVVCKNSTDQIYYVKPDPSYTYTFEWKVPEGKILEDKGDTIVVQWKPLIPAGFINVKANSSSGTCDFESNAVVHIRDLDAPQKPYVVFMDKSRRTLACSDTSDGFYRWIKVTGGKEIIMGETEKPFFNMGVNASAGEIFYVEKAFSKESCYTRSYPCSN